MVTKVLMEALSPTMELQARGAGVLRKIVAGEGATVEVGKLVGVIADAEEDISAVLGGAETAESDTTPDQPEEREDAPEEREEKTDAAEAPTPTPAADDAPAAPAPAGDESRRVKASPLARRLAQERGLDLTRIAGSGPGGRR